MAKIITEDMIEKAAIEMIVSLYPTYSHLDCYTHERETLPDGTDRANKKQVVLPQVLADKLCELNPDIPGVNDNIKMSEIWKINLINIDYSLV